MKTRKRARRTALLLLIVALLGLLFWVESGFRLIIPTAEVHRIAQKHLVEDFEILGRGDGGEFICLADGEIMVISDDIYTVAFAETKDGCALFPCITHSFDDVLHFTGWCPDTSAVSADMSVHISRTGLFEADYAASCDKLENGLARFNVEPHTVGILDSEGEWMPERLAFWYISSSNFHYGLENYDLSCSVRFYNAAGEIIAEGEFEY